MRSFLEGFAELTLYWFAAAAVMAGGGGLLYLFFKLWARQ